MSLESRDFLRHILVEADYLIGRSAGLSYDVFAADETLRRAFVRSLEIIGEAAKKVPDEFRATHPTVGWTSNGRHAGPLDSRLLRCRLRVSSGTTRVPAAIRSVIVRGRSLSRWSSRARTRRFALRST